jgi:pimeloyl-ACP methyl ester carboxylesterase
VAAALVVILVLAYFGLGAYMFDKLTRPDKKALVGTPQQYGMAYENVSFNSTVDNIPLKGWFIDSPGDKAIIMLHGRLGNRSMDESLDKAVVLHAHNYDLLMFDFRDCGESGGDRYTLGVWEMRDLEAALGYMKAKGYSELGTYGISMGAATSVMVAPSHPEIKALLVDSPYADLPALIDLKLPESSGLPAFFNPGVLWMGNLIFGVDFSGAKPADTLAKLGDRPIFQVYSKDGDNSIPLDQHYAFAKAGASDPNFSTWAAPGSGHVDAFPNNKEEYSTRMAAFFEKYLK